ncbi:MAG: sigma-54-dependent Fis family transcriptional regulator [Deltaproteobacteria bacterium]|nr:sigma-54-dependent Fis family transcriptional regulator [Deltaproteobacteria bacterium]
MANERILVVDDEQGIRDLVSDILASDGYEVDAAPSAAAALELIEERDFAIVLSDVRMPGMSGIELLSELKKRRPDLPVILLTAFGTIPQAVEAIREGALDFLEKPIKSPKVLRGIVRRGINASYRDVTAAPPTLPDFVCEDPVSRSTRELLDKVAPRDTTVLLTGESGSGKEVAARYIHALSSRSSGPFVPVNAAAIPSNLLEDELFGHEKGAFTGADRQRQGLFEAADDGTLFLDEIGEMSSDLQTRLLRVLETQSFQRLGSSTQTEVDVRLIAATNSNLRKAVREGGFREDLYYRLSVFPVHLHPLRERPADILPLAHHFAAQISGGNASLTADAESSLASHAWPGNARELRNVIERALVLAPSGTIESSHLALEEPAVVAPSGTLKDMERQAVIRALDQAGGNRKEASRILGISLRNLQYKIKEYGLKKR